MKGNTWRHACTPSASPPPACAHPKLKFLQNQAVVKDIQGIEHVMPGLMRQNQGIIQELLQWDGGRDGVEHVGCLRKWGLGILCIKRLA